MIFKGKRFFIYLNSGPMKDIIKEDKKNMCIVQMTKKSLRYHSFFESWKTFYHWYLALEEHQRTFSEVICDRNQKFRLDIETVDPTIIRSHWLEIINEIYKVTIRILLDVSQLKDPRELGIIIYESVDDKKKKYSSHIVVSKVCFGNSQECATICNIIMNNLSDKAKACVDTEVYKSLQYFRLEGSTKENNNRYKYLFGEKKISNQFLEGVISNTNKCRIIKVKYNTEINHLSRFTNIGQKNMLFDKSLTPRKKIQLDNGRILILYKNSGGYFCTLCKKIHDKENPFIIIDPETRNESFYCRRFGALG